jgi:YfiH family protein
LADAIASVGVEVIRTEALAGIPHGFLGRRGGMSSGLVAGLNVGLGSGDDAIAVAQNRARAAAAVLPGATLVACYQVHSPDCVTVTEAWSDAERPHADALVTSRAGVLLAIVTADCSPVLLADREVGVIGAAHAGWKGAIGGVVENTVAAMLALGARREAIAAAIGPTIAQPSYEVDKAFRDRFVADDSANVRYFARGTPGHWQFDLPGYVAERLASIGVATVETLGLDTYAAPDRFYSFRRATHRGEPAYGRQMSLIGLPPS